MSALSRRRIAVPLTARIFAVNVFALLMLAGGVLYLDTFRTRLLEQRQDQLATQAQLIAAAIEAQGYAPRAPEVRTLVQRMTENARWFVQIYDQRPVMAFDSRFLTEERIRALPRPKPLILRRRVALVLDELIDWAGAFPQLPPYEIDPKSGFPEVRRSMNGTISHQMRRTWDGQVVVTVAAPLRQNGQIIGSILLGNETRDIRRIVRAERMTLFQIFLMVLGLSLLLSFFQARTIVRPIRRLALAADRVRQGRAREVSVPRFVKRSDEIGQLARAVSDMTQTLRQRMDAIDAFAADVTHEIKNPLSSLRSAVDTLPKVQDPNLQKDLLGIIREDVIRIDRLITDISDASRLDSELSRVQLEPVDLGALLRALVEVYTASGRASPVQLRLSLAESVPFITFGLERRLSQVLRNLVDNAISFSPPNGVVQISGALRDNQISISIDDDGPGIPEENRDDIFKRFYSHRPQAEDFGQHSGLGLAIAKQIVEAHGGTIQAENRMSGSAILGASFRVNLPLAR